MLNSNEIHCIVYLLLFSFDNSFNIILDIDSDHNYENTKLKQVFYPICLLSSAILSFLKILENIVLEKSNQKNQRKE